MEGGRGGRTPQAYSSSHKTREFEVDMSGATALVLADSSSQVGAGTGSNHDYVDMSLQTY